jgi:hypothetical protein
MSALPHSSDDYAAFEAELALGRRLLSRRDTRELLGVSDRALDRLVESGALEAFTIGRQKQGFLSSRLVKLMWDSRKVPTREPAPAPKPRTSRQLSPPRGRGRPRVGGAYGGQK